MRAKAVSQKPRAVAMCLMVAGLLMMACGRPAQGPPADVATDAAVGGPAGTAVVPVLVSEPVAVDSDDPAIWINPEDPAASLVLGTDKGGALYVFNLDGKILADKTVSGQARINNVDVEYGMMLGGVPTDIAVASDRDANLLRAYKVPDMTPIDNGGFPAFEGLAPELRRPMGVALFKRPADGAVFVVVSRKAGPSGAYLWQYRLEDDGNGALKATKVREFGEFSGGDSEIEAVAVDDDLGYVYYSDEAAGVYKYPADPDVPDANEPLALFGTTGFTEDREGISIYRTGEGTGYLLVSDQQANAFRVFPREGVPGAPHEHPEIAVFQVSTNESDGSEVTNVPLGDRFPAGLFVAMSDNRTFQYYSWLDIEKAAFAGGADPGPAS
jgi:3-phytase